MNDSHQNLVEVRRSSGEKEWMTREKLEALNKQRALKREQFKKTDKARLEIEVIRLGRQPHPRKCLDNWGRFSS